MDALGVLGVIFKGFGLLRQDIPITVNNKPVENVQPPNIIPVPPPNK
jgi:hypothetical protein